MNATGFIAMVLVVGAEGAAPSATARADHIWRGPVYVHVEPGADELILLFEKSGTIARCDSRTGLIVTEVDVGAGPFDLCAHPDGRRFFVSCRKGQFIAEVDAATLQTLRTFPLRGDPTGVAVSGDGRRLYVGVHSLDQVAVLDVESGEPLARLAAGNGPEQVRLAPAEGRVYVTNLLPNAGPPQQSPRLEITVIDDRSARVVERIELPNANVGRGIGFASDGALAVAVISRPKNLIPMVQVARGWVVTNGFALLLPGGDDQPLQPVQMLIDLPNRFFADPYGVALTPDDGKFYLTSAGMDMVLAVDVDAARKVAAQARSGQIPRAADHLGLSRRYVTARIPVGANPQALACSPDGRRLYVANRLDDTISVIDIATDRVTQTLAIHRADEPPYTPPGRGMARGERLFHSAARTFHGQFSCTSCHPDHGFDALQYDLEPDDVGRNFVDNRNLRGVDATEPFKWAGTNPDITTQCGTRTAKWIMRTGWLTLMQVVDLTAFIHSLQPVENPYRDADGRLTTAQQRGKTLFERTTTNDGTPIADRDRCDFCHRGPRYTNHQPFDVGTKAPLDGRAIFDTAHLVNIFESAPFLHDGRARTLEEIWTICNPDDRHGISSDWTKRQLNDLVEYLKTL